MAEEVLTIPVPAGYGRTGFCKVCSSPLARDINRLLKNGQNAGQITRYAEAKGLKLHRETIYSHRDHVTAGQDKLVNWRAKAPVVIRKTTNQQFLETVRDIGMSKAMSDPDLVDVNHALKAVALMEAKRDRGDSITLILAQIVTGHRPADLVIEGTAEEIE